MPALAAHAPPSHGVALTPLVVVNGTVAANVPSLRARYLRRGFVDLAFVADVLPDKENVAKDLGVFNIAGALPFAIAPAIAPVILALGNGSYAVLYTVAGACALVGAIAIVPVRGAR